MFIVESKIDFKEFDKYRNAEIFCAENGIAVEEIYEEE